MGVADGIRGWRQLGLSNREFSMHLMENCRDLVAGEAGQALHPKEVMVRAVAGTKCLGSSIVLLGCITGSSFLATNLGNSGFILLRAWQIVEASKPMQASFSVFQVGYDPAGSEKR
ncbi:hypothetical protein L7F22_031286 [Adiantum nelumboides]|nr:hypothetical protein [Adiantum nelumboides]